MSYIFFDQEEGWVTFLSKVFLTQEMRFCFHFVTHLCCAVIFGVIARPPSKNIMVHFLVSLRHKQLDIGVALQSFQWTVPAKYKGLIARLGPRRKSP